MLIWILLGMGLSLGTCGLVSGAMALPHQVTGTLLALSAVCLVLALALDFNRAPPWGDL